MSVAQRDVAAAVLGDLRVVGHEYDGTSLGMQFLEKNQYLERGTGIEISGRFIGEDDGGVVYQRPGMATRCICPPDIWLLLCIRRSPRPTATSDSTAFLCRSAAL